MNNPISNIANFEELKSALDQITCLMLNTRLDQANVKFALAMAEKIMDTLGFEGRHKRKVFNVMMEMFWQISRAQKLNLDDIPVFKCSIKKRDPLLYYKHQAWNQEQIAYLKDDLDIVLSCERAYSQVFYRDLFKKHDSSSMWFDLLIGFIDIIRMGNKNIFYQITPQEVGNPSFELLVQLDL